jgi:hypothetical protein
MGAVDLVLAALMTPPAPYSAPPPPPWYTEWATGSTVLLYAALMVITLVLMAFFGVMLFLIFKLKGKMEPMLGKAPPVAKKVETVTATGSDKIMQVVMEFYAWDTAIRTGIRAFFRPRAGTAPGQRPLPQTPGRRELAEPQALGGGPDGRFPGRRAAETGSGYEREQRPVG